MEQYRIRLKSGRLVGPFQAEDILEMKLKSHVDGNEICQLFPAGDWVALRELSFWNKSGAGAKTIEGTFVVNLADLAKEIPAPESKAKEIDLSKTDQITVAAPAGSTGTIEKNRPRQQFREFDYKSSQQDEEILPRHKDISTKNEVTEHTRITPDAEIKHYYLDGAQNATVVSPEGKKWQEELERERKREEERLHLEAIKRKREEEQMAANAPVPAPEPIPVEIISSRDATQAISLQNIKGLRRRAVMGEKELAEEAEKEKRESTEQGAELSDEKPTKKKSRSSGILLVAAGIILGYTLLFPDEKTSTKPNAVTIKTVDPDIQYPVPFKSKDSAKAKSLNEQALAQESQNTYPGLSQAAKLWRMSYENDIDQEGVRQYLLRDYAKLLPHSSKREEDGNVVFKLLQANKLLMTIDPDVCLAAGLFYRYFHKDAASFLVLDRFVKSQSNKPSKELFAVYLEALIQQDMETKADDVATSLIRAGTPGIEVALALVNYHRYKNHPEEARKTLNEVLSRHTQSVPLLLARGDLEVEQGDMKALAQTVDEVFKLGAESSRAYYGKWLEFKGLLYVAGNKPKEAAKAFKESLVYADSEELRDRLASIKNINETSDGEAAMLLKQVHARAYVQEAEKALESFDFQGALLSAINAQSLHSGYMKADLFLAELQMRLGMTKEALAQLEKFQEENPGDPGANFALVKANIDTYRFTEARRLLAILASGELRNNWQYSSLQARLYEKMGDINLSAGWLQKAINANPLEDANVFTLAKLLIRAKRFGQAKNRLYEAMELDPSNVEYKITYASIIYEQDGPDPAVAYLYGLLQQFPKNPSILGQIAIYYHRAGKIKQFQEVKKEVESLATKDPRIYRFLIHSSLLDEQWDNAIRYTEELVKLEPGDLAAMMEIGRTLMQLGRYKEAAMWFVRVRDKLSTYPKVGYYKARIELYVGDRDQALKDVQEDIKTNGAYEEGVVLIGDILRAQEKFGEAEDRYKEAFKLNRKSPGALRGLAAMAIKKGQLDVALDLLKRALVESKDDPEIYRQMGDLYRLLGQGPLAIESYRVYLKLLPAAPDKAQVEEFIRILE